jgi:hypothetical protein
MVRRDVADTVARRLDGRDLDLGQLGENVRRLLELYPVVLDVLPRREVAEASVVDTRYMGEFSHLTRGQRPIRDVDAQHIGMQLQVEPVHQAQRLELILVELAGQTAANLSPELPNALGYQLVIEFVIPIHGSSLWPRPPRF